MSAGTSVCLAQEPLDVPFKVAGQELPAVAPERDAVTAHQELLKVPGHVVAADGAPGDEFGVSDEGGGVVAGRRQLLPEE